MRSCNASEKGGNNEKKNYQSDCCEKHECCGQHELARPICGNLSGSITARSQPLRAKRSSPVGREDKPSHSSCQHSYTKLNNRGDTKSDNRSTTLSKTAVINYILVISLWVLYISLCFFGLEVFGGLTKKRGGYVRHPSGGGPCVKFCVQLSRFGSSARSVVLLRLIHSDQRGCLKFRVKVFVILSTTLNIYLTAY